jgi:hypothetical protein
VVAVARGESAAPEQPYDKPKKPNRRTYIFYFLHFVILWSIRRLFARLFSFFSRWLVDNGNFNLATFFGHYCSRRRRIFCSTASFSNFVFKCTCVLQNTQKNANQKHEQKTSFFVWIFAYFHWIGPVKAH